MAVHLRIGEVLTEKGYVTEKQVEEALQYQKEHRDLRLGQIFLQLGFATEKQVLDALASKLQLEIVDIAQVNVDIEAVGTLKKDFAEKNLLLPIAIENRVLKIVTNDPLNYFALEEVRQQTGYELQIFLSEEEPLKKAISYYFSEVNARRVAMQAQDGFERLQIEELDIEDLDDSQDEAPIIRLLNSLIERAIKSNASDIHIEPFEKETRVRMRIDGVIMDYLTIPKNVHSPLIARIKIKANLDIAEKRLPQDGHFRVNSDDEQINLRVSLLPTVYGEKAVLRLMATTTNMNYANHFGMDDYSYQQFLPMLNHPNGIIYITGPTGSGKSTTLYMVLEYLSGRHVNISTIEDPVEKRIEGINQSQVNNVSGLTFDVGLRALMRQDPDIIMVGETRDVETASTSVRAAITGHIVLSTLHTNDAASSIVRLEDMGVETYLVANSLVGLVAQRLVRKVCPDCAREMETTPQERLILGKDLKYVKRGVGCAKCNHTGYSGRIAIHEILSVDNDIRKMIANHASVEEIKAYAIEHQHMRTLKQSALALVEEGVTTPEELYKISYE